MFEYWFLSPDSFDDTGTTHDFLEVISQIAYTFGPVATGEFVQHLTTEYHDKLAYLRMIDWEFVYEVKPGNQTIKLRKLI